jgi:triosephosphate isomerase (TIM)
MREWVVAGNWKMNNTIEESLVLAGKIKDETAGVSGGRIIVAPPFTALSSVYGIIKNSQVKLAAQNLFFEEKGAYTGEISPAMLKDAGCTYVIIGHSERRKYFHELDENVNLKVKKALEMGLRVIMCVGETDEERTKGITQFVVGIQLKKGLANVPSLDNIIVAYEPVWAIGTGKTATADQAQEVHAFIRRELTSLYGVSADATPILYGGSVTPDNIAELGAMADVDGALVGGASLKAESFVGIIKKLTEKR